MIWLAYTTLATRSLHKESSQVASALRVNDLALARRRLSLIVSRETSQLDEAAIVRALVETVSENISDAIVAPLFYLAHLRSGWRSDIQGDKYHGFHAGLQERTLPLLRLFCGARRRCRKLHPGKDQRMAAGGRLGLHGQGLALLRHAS